MSIAWLTDRFRREAARDAVVWRDRTTRYGELLERIDAASAVLAARGVQPGEAVLLDADFSPGSIALLIAAIANRNVVVPAAAHVANLDRERYARIAEASHAIRVLEDDRLDVTPLPHRVTHPLTRELVDAGAPGLVLFSSGSTGEPKAALHNLDALLRKFEVERHRQRIVTFLLFDHIGGFNSLMYALANTGCVITLEGRDVAAVCRAIERHRAEVLPTSPTFLNLLMASEAWTRHDLSSLRTITYGTEPMSENTLRRVHAALPAVTLQQTYGLSELGILRSQSRGPDSLWVRIGGEGYELRVVDGLLEIKAKAAILGYLNAPSPITEDGWFRTGDAVEVDGEWIRILGRRTEIINVGGEKVYPAEVEGVLLEMPGVAEVAVHAEKNAITGQLVAVRVRLSEPATAAEFRRRMTAFCKDRLARYKIPQKVTVVDGPLHSERFKVMRRAS